MNTVAAARSTAGLARWAALGGIVYVVLFVIGVIVMFDGEPNGDASPARVIAYYSDSGHRNKIMFGWLIAGLGIFAFLWFLSSLRRAVRRWEGEDGFLTALTTIGGAIYATLAFAAIALNVGIRTMSDDTYHHTVFPGLIHAADDASYVMHATGGAGVFDHLLSAGRDRPLDPDRERTAVRARCSRCPDAGRSRPELVSEPQQMSFSAADRLSL
jgi:hypothetical protein